MHKILVHIILHNAQSPRAKYCSSKTPNLQCQANAQIPRHISDVQNPRTLYCNHQTHASKEVHYTKFPSSAQNPRH
jgi:hypothetical protein